MGVIKKTSYRLDSDLIKQVKQRALDKECHSTDIITEALKLYFGNHKGGKK